MALKKRLIAILFVAISAGILGYILGIETVAGGDNVIKSPAPESVRVIYSLDTKQTDKELIALINNADEYIHFAIYTFTLDSVADALIKAKKRGVDVRGLVDGKQSRTSYSAPIIEKMIDGGIPLLTERHINGNGIMHLKLLVTEKAYATGSYNWTKSANTLNDEIIQIGTAEHLRQEYNAILLRLFDEYSENTVAAGAATVFSGTYTINEAKSHIGEYASVSGTLVSTYKSSKGTLFLDFCKNYKTCPFSGVAFADDASAFEDIEKLVGKTITLTGTITSYEGRAEIKLHKRSQIHP